METIIKIIGAVVLFFATVLLFAVVFTLPVYLLWNWLMPLIFGLKTLTFFQSWGIMFLSGCLFKSFGAGSGNK